ncbi:MAG TPA: class I SAM-dependent methyltransferase [Acidimicrobiales bacterium]|jgi:ubiquinone/menaquinone biosynthesis C-methylase UbiE|nr:class I SAM-dependent methyltransferase [Acidimicrobiales bacterium]
MTSHGGRAPAAGPVSAASASVPTGNVYAKYQTDHPVEGALMGRFLRRLDGAVAACGSPQTILEVGTGEGEIAARMTRRFPEAVILGVDLPDPSLAQDWAGASWGPAFADAGHLPVRDGSIDLVLAIEVLEHLADPEAALAELARVGRGWVVVSVPLEPLWRVGNVVRRRYLRSLGNTPGHVQHWSRRGFVSSVRRHLDVHQVMSPLPWTLVVARPRRSPVRLDSGGGG